MDGLLFSTHPPGSERNFLTPRLLDVNNYTLYIVEAFWTCGDGKSSDNTYGVANCHTPTPVTMAFGHVISIP